MLIKSGFYIVRRPSTALKPSNVATFHGQSKLEYSILDLYSVQQFTFQRDHSHGLKVRIKARINGKRFDQSYLCDEDKDEAGMFLTTIIELNQGDKVSCKKGFNSWKHYHSLILFFFKLTSTFIITGDWLYDVLVSFDVEAKLPPEGAAMHCSAPYFDSFWILKIK